MAKNIVKHTHKLKRLKFKSGNATFFCTLPDCTFKINPALALGKRSICWRCGEEFLLGDYSLRLAKPHCENCHKPKNDIKIDSNVKIEFPTSISTAELSLAERLSQSIKDASREIEKGEIEEGDI